MKKILSNLILGIVLISQANIDDNIFMKTLCVDGYEFVVTYVNPSTSKNGLLGPLPNTRTYDATINVNQVYEKIDDNAGNLSSVPKKCR